MEVVFIVDEGLGNSSYLVDLGDGDAMIVDPERDPRRYLAQLERRRLRRWVVIETHLHADFISGGRELAAQGAQLWAPAGSSLSYVHRPLHDSQELAVGDYTLRAIATPGHTPEHLSYLIMDGTRPLALFSGGTLMTGGVARTDLLGPEQTEPLARAAFRSIKEVLFSLPDDLPVYPTHGPGSLCSVGGDGERTTTIGREKRANALFARGADEDTFVERLLAGYGSYPPYFRQLREVNQRGPAVHGPEPAPPRSLPAAEVEQLLQSGAELIDVRSTAAFASGHIPGSLSVPWRPQFSTWLGWVVERETPLVFVVDVDSPIEEILWASLTIGFETLVGTLELSAWSGEGRHLEEVPLIRDPADAGDRVIVDVRQDSEYLTGHLPEAIHVELGALEPATGRVPGDGLLVHCAHGARAMTGASLLLRGGHRDVAVLDGPPTMLGDLATS